MPTAIWTGTIGFGLVNVPVRLYPATKRKDVRFHELDLMTGQRIRHQRVRPIEADELMPPPPLPEPRPGTGREARGLVDRQLAEMLRQPVSAAPREVQAEDVRKGFEVARGQYVMVSPEELARLAPERSRVIEIAQFVDVSAVDPIYFDSNYYAVPERDAVRSFALLRDGIQKTGTLAISWFMLRRKRRLAAVRPFGNVMLVTTMLHADEILLVPQVEGAEPADLTSKEREMAALLINTLRGPFEPERYPDEYRQKLLAMLEGRAGSAIQTRETARSNAVPDLMAALRASVEQAKKARQKPAAKPIARRRRKSA